MLLFTFSSLQNKYIFRLRRILWNIQKHKSTILCTWLLLHNSYLPKFLRPWKDLLTWSNWEIQTFDLCQKKTKHTNCAELENLIDMLAKFWQKPNSSSPYLIRVRRQFDICRTMWGRWLPDISQFKLRDLVNVVNKFI